MIGRATSSAAPASRRCEEHPDRFFGSFEVNPNRGMEGVRDLVRAVEELGVQGGHRVPRRDEPAGADQRQEVLPHLRQVRRARHPDLRVHRRARAPGADGVPEDRAHRRGVLVLPRAEVRDAPRRRAVGRARREAHAQVAEPLLLDLRLRAAATTPSRSSTTRTPAAPTRSCTPATSRWACRSSASSASCPTSRSRTTCGRSSCARTRCGCSGCEAQGDRAASRSRSRSGGSASATPTSSPPATAQGDLLLRPPPRRLARRRRARCTCRTPSARTSAPTSATAARSSDGCITCPFHGWKFDAEGANVDIPYSERVNRKARLRTYPVVEVNGLSLRLVPPRRVGGADVGDAGVPRVRRRPRLGGGH